MYIEQESTFVTLDEQLSKALPDSAFDLDKSVQDFKKLNQNKWKTFEDIKLCKAIEVPVDKILIDETVQRPLNIKQIYQILTHFSECMVNSIHVYKDPIKPGYYIAWDGQHTAIALYIICTRVFGQRASDVMVPVVIYDKQMKLDIHRKHKYFIIDNLKMNRVFATVDEQHYNKLAGSNWPTFNDFCENNYIVNDDIRNEIESYKESLSYDTLGPPEGPNTIITDKELIVSMHQETYELFHEQKY